MGGPNVMVWVGKTVDFCTDVHFFHGNIIAQGHWVEMRKLIVFLFMWPTTPYHLRDFRVVGYLQFFFVLGIALVLYLDIYPLNLLLTCLSIVLYADSPKIYIFVENMPQQRGGAFLNSLSVITVFSLIMRIL